MSPRNYLPHSLLLNGLLVVTVGMLVYFQSHQPLPPQAQATNSPSESKRESVHSSTPAPFQWSNLDSEDYPTYIQNLRSVNCPEQTIRAIIASELNEFYAANALELQSQGLTGFELARATDRLKAEQASVFNQLFPSASNTASGQSVATNTPSRFNSSVANSATSTNEQPVAVPLFYGQPSRSLELDRAQMNAWRNLQQRFIAEVGGPSQNPYDPEYRKRWAKAQDDLDEVLHAQLGDENYNALVLQRNAEANK